VAASGRLLSETWSGLRGHQKIAHQMKARRWDSRDEADDEVAGLKQNGAGAVFPDVFESELELAIGAEFQAVLSKRGARDIPAKAL